MCFVFSPEGLPAVCARRRRSVFVFALLAMFAAALPEGRTEALAPAAHLRLSAILEFGDRVQAGILNTQTNRSHVLSPGGSVDGFELVSVDARKERAVLERNGESVVLRLVGGPPAPARAPARARPAATAPVSPDDRALTMRERASVQMAMSRLRRMLHEAGDDAETRAAAIQAFEEQMKERGHQVEAQDRDDGSLQIQVRGEGFSHVNVIGASSAVRISVGGP